ncbi:MAG: hypothetical protein HY879_26440 [Deltaproteobacteria bacterium]|nr:hypothetical protein [Deltaproteobacteria bacterium]
MTILFTQDFDIFPGKEDDFEKFIADYIPQCDRMGLPAVGGFYVEVGFGPRIVGIRKTNSLDELYRVMAGTPFKESLLELKKYVINYQSKILEPTGRVKHEGYEIQKGVWKYNQYYDLIPGKKKEYADFVMNEHLPALQKIDYLEVTGGWNVVIGGFSEIVTEFTFKSPIDIGRMLDNEDFKRITRKLRLNYVLNFKSRIMRTTERFEEPRWYRL